MSSITEDDQQRLLEHYAVGLRGILAEHDDLTDPALTAKMRALRDDAPVRLEHRFWGAQFLAMAFGHELGFAAAHPPALRAIFNLGVVAAENGLVPFKRCARRTDSSPGSACSAATGSIPEPRARRLEPRDPEGGDRPWELFASDRLRVAAREAAAGLVARGSAVVDGALGPRLAEAASAALTRHVATERHLFSAGHLGSDGTKRCVHAGGYHIVDLRRRGRGRGASPGRGDMGRSRAGFVGGSPGQVPTRGCVSHRRRRADVPVVSLRSRHLGNARRRPHVIG